MNWQTGNTKLWQLPILVMARTYAKLARVIGRRLEKLWQHRGVYIYPRLPLALPIDDGEGEKRREKTHKPRPRRSAEKPTPTTW